MTETPVSTSPAIQGPVNGARSRDFHRLTVKRVEPLRWAEKTGTFDQIFKRMNGAVHEEVMACGRS